MDKLEWEVRELRRAGRSHGATPSESGKVSVVSEIAHDVFHGGAGFYLVQIFTTGILILGGEYPLPGLPRNAGFRRGPQDPECR